MRNLNLFIIFILFLTLAACRSESEISAENTVETIVKTGNLSGRVMSQNGNKPIGGASVFTFDDKYKIYFTSSDSDGNFTLEAPIGDQKIFIQTGDGSNFRTEISATVKLNETLVLNTTQTKLNQVAKIAYVKGSYDEIEEIIQNLGYNATEITNADLANITTISQYDIIFLNCGSRNSPSDHHLYNAIEANLATFVTNGGSIYASDWDVAYLVGGNNNSTTCSPPGGFIPDSKLCSINSGNSGITPSTVSNTGLSNALGFNTLDIDFDMAMWQKIINYDNSYWEVLVKETASSNPLMIRTNHFTSSSAPVVQIGNASNSAFTTVCITLPGNIKISLSVPTAIVPYLVALGATVGPCSGTTNSGYIYFTSFHNHASGNIGNAALILQYVILNL